MPSEDAHELLPARLFPKAKCRDRCERRRKLDPTVEPADILRWPRPILHVFPGMRRSHSALARTLAQDEWPFQIQKLPGPYGRVDPKDRRSRNGIRRSWARCVMLAQNDFVPRRARPSPSTVIQD